MSKSQLSATEKELLKALKLSDKLTISLMQGYPVDEDFCRTRTYIMAVIANKGKIK